MKLYLKETSAVLDEVNTTPDGLSTAEAAARLEKNGKNKLAEYPCCSKYHRCSIRAIRPLPSKYGCKYAK